MAGAGLGTVLMGLAGPIARQVMISFGVGVVTFVGLNTAVTTALGSAKTALGGLSADFVQILALGGIFTSLSIMAGGVMAGVSMIALKRFQKI